MCDYCWSDDMIYLAPVIQRSNRDTLLHCDLVTIIGVMNPRAHKTRIKMLPSETELRSMSALHAFSEMLSCAEARQSASYCITYWAIDSRNRFLIWHYYYRGELTVNYTHKRFKVSSRRACVRTNSAMFCNIAYNLQIVYICISYAFRINCMCN